MAANPTVIKAASHLPQRPRFAILREDRLAHAPSVWQDETGLDYALLAGAFDVRLYGDFSRANRLFAPGSQAALAAAYRNAGAEPLPFRVGYEKRSGSTVQVAVRDPRTLEARLAERIAQGIARYESRPRKLFVSGAEGDGYVAALRAQVGRAAAPLAARRDPARAALVTLTLAPDGSLRELEFDRSSGDATLDRSLRESVRSSAPFPPLPEAIRGRADLLVVTLQLPER
jgi:TonB family protein